jgi:hypothetical protein
MQAWAKLKQNLAGKKEPKGEKCKICSKTVYAMEKTTVNEMTFHTTCFSLRKYNF